LGVTQFLDLERISSVWKKHRDIDIYISTIYCIDDYHRNCHYMEMPKTHNNGSFH